MDEILDEWVFMKNRGEKGEIAVGDLRKLRL